MQTNAGPKNVTLLFSKHDSNAASRLRYVYVCVCVCLWVYVRDDCALIWDNIIMHIDHLCACQQIAN